MSSWADAIRPKQQFLPAYPQYNRHPNPKKAGKPQEKKESKKEEEQEELEEIKKYYGEQA